MSELKELSWDAQESVQPLPFEDLERRGLRRRHRRQALTGAGVVAAVAVAVLAAVLPLGNVTGTEKPPAASIPVDQAAEKLVHDKKSGGAGIAFGTPTRWASVWSSPQPGYTWNYAAVLSRDGVRTTAPVRKNQYVVLRAGDEALAVSMPTSMKGTDPTWAQSVMVRLTDQGRIEKKLQWAPPTSEFGAGDVLLAYGTLRALNLETGVLREVKVPGIDNAYEPYLDTTGRWWLVGAKNSGLGNIYWTDDHGKTWEHSLIGEGSTGGRLAVSPNGKTMVLIPSGKPGVRRDPVPVRLSTDRGEHWTTVASRNPPYLSSPVAFDNGTGLALYQGKKRELLRPGAGTPFTPPADLGGLTAVGDFVYSMQYNGDQAMTSTDHGKTWKYFTPR
ncbi:sialidase family protein [Kribbella speibonae]|uniref:Exo-alpha-sialidase n=1 Tax=Kribbella speibonae TaxID=1572660 RepID=A0ABY1ZW85_9ACTN|nr:sialidase family protein [Kribbella speibonae]TCC18868.1 exo-alpha-sialidase [Kribbella speibonae]